MNTRSRTITSRSAVAGFSLAEVLIAAVILLILVAFSFPLYKSTSERAQRVTCASSMRQLSVALFAYRGEHNGWFPPGEPAKAPVPGQSGLAELKFYRYLLPTYAQELPMCPGYRLTPEGERQFPNTKARLQILGGGYAINAVLTQWKIEAMPWPAFLRNVSMKAYDSSRIPFLLENGYANASWSFDHQRQALNGVRSYHIAGRSHGGGDMLNFMFLDGHMKAISRNDRRRVAESEKTWMYPANPHGEFATWGVGGRYFQHNLIRE